jgi:hypothetical protein
LVRPPLLSRNVGRRFEDREKATWQKLDSGRAETEARTVFERRRGRVDVRVDEEDGSVSIVELKATDWDRMKANRVRPNALRHARQVWRYVNAELSEGAEVCPGVVYESTPSDHAVRSLVEETLNEPHDPGRVARRSRRIVTATSQTRRDAHGVEIEHRVDRSVFGTAEVIVGRVSTMRARR